MYYKIKWIERFHLNIKFIRSSQYYIMGQIDQIQMLLRKPTHSFARYESEES